ncbi:MAG: hypothetical protein HKP61_17575 [Dactylosporangium sp.]|nr:hypothetical protein [Dactylosporangium sp.]NNJ62718.1 hypothetical protein [Dactylosporangium sp.]
MTRSQTQQTPQLRPSPAGLLPVWCGMGLYASIADEAKREDQSGWRP